MLIQSCKSSKIQPSEYKKNKVFFGSGGGFTGAVEEYCLLQNASFWKAEKDSLKYNFLHNIDRKQCKELFSQLALKTSTAEECNNPGNLYYFIRLEMDDIQKKYTWGDQTEIINSEIKELYNNLNQLTEKNESIEKNN